MTKIRSGGVSERPAILADIDKLISDLGLPEKFTGALSQYARKVALALEPLCVILYGSLARDTYTTTSDIDLVVVSPNLPEHFLDRLATLQDLNDTACSIDAFGYTSKEFHQMLAQGHVTALDAVADGIPLQGQEYFGQLREIFQDMVRQGLRRSSCTWVLPLPVSSSS